MKYLYLTILIIAIWKTKGLLLSTISRILTLICAPLNTLATIWVNRKESGAFKKIDDDLFNSAYEVDVFGNYNLKNLWNTIFIKKDGYKFGQLNKKGYCDESISSVLGENQNLGGKLIPIGWAVLFFLFFIDFMKWFKGGHCKSARANYLESQTQSNNMIELTTNNDYEQVELELDTYFATANNAVVDLMCSTGEPIWVENVNILANGSYRGTAYNSTNCASSSDIIDFMPNHLFVMWGGARPTGR